MTMRVDENLADRYRGGSIANHRATAGYLDGHQSRTTVSVWVNFEGRGDGVKDVAFDFPDPGLDGRDDRGVD
jgi:hypothetical protein